MTQLLNRFADSLVGDIALMLLLLGGGKLVGAFAPGLTDVAVLLAFLIGAFWFER